MNVVAEPQNLNETSFKQRKLELIVQEQREENERRKQHKSPFEKFYQVNKDNSNFLRSCLRENPRALELLLFIFDHMDKYNAVVCSYKVFQEALGMSTRTITRCISYLKTHGFIAILKSGTSNIYVANKDLVWNSWGNNQKYCEFPANVVLSQSEQTEITEVMEKKMTEMQIKKPKK